MANSPTTAAFLTPYQIGKVLSGVIPANRVKRPLWYRTFFGRVDTTTYPTVNFDLEYIQKNVMGRFVDANADPQPIQLADFGTQEMTFAYSKEGLNSPDYEELIQRRLGQQFGNVDVLGNEAWILQQKLMFAEQRFENLDEMVARDIIFYGGYSAKSELHKDIKYNFNRTIASTFADVLGDLVPAVNLTTNPIYRPWDATNVYMPVLPNATVGSTSYVAGQKAWTKANIDAGTATPVKDVVKMYETAQFRSGTEAFVMAADAYSMFNYDIEQNYPSAADATLQVLLSTKRDILPRAKDVQGLTFKRSWPVSLESGGVVDIYVYDGIYQSRDTAYDNDSASWIAAGTNVKYTPNGWVVSIPSSDNGIKVYGRIKHPRAGWQPLPRWLNFWEDIKSGKKEWEYHQNFVMGHLDINSVIAWKVL